MNNLVPSDFKNYNKKVNQLMRKLDMQSIKSVMDVGIQLLFYHNILLVFFFIIHSAILLYTNLLMIMTM